MTTFRDFASSPVAWNAIQRIFGAPEFKVRMYSSFLTDSGTLLDFGCATGHIADAFAKYEYYGIDLDNNAINQAKRTYADRPNMHFVCADIRTRPFPENYFDQILLAGTVHHLSDSQFLAVLSELHRCLKPTGTLHIIDPVRQPNDGFQARLLRWLDKGRYPRTLGKIEALVESTHKFQLGKATLHRPYGALIQDCDFAHLPITKTDATPS